MCRRRGEYSCRKLAYAAFAVAACWGAPALAQAKEFYGAGDGMDAACAWRAASGELACRYRLHDPGAVDGVKASLGRTALDARTQPFAQGAPGTSAVLLALDVGISPANRLAHLEQLIDAGAPGHRFALATFDGELSTLAAFGSTAAALKQAAAEIGSQDRPTELYRIALEATRLLAREPAQRKALVLFSDGIADDRAYFHRDVVSAARGAGVVVYGIGYAGSVDEVVALQSLRRLADETGGRFIAADEAGNVPRSFFDDLYKVLDNGGELIFGAEAADAFQSGSSATLALELATSGGPASARITIDPPLVPAGTPTAGARDSARGAGGAIPAIGGSDGRTLLYVLIGVGQLAVLLGIGAMLWRARRRKALNARATGGPEVSPEAAADSPEALAPRVQDDGPAQGGGRVQARPVEQTGARPAAGNGLTGSRTGTGTGEGLPEFGQRTPVPVEESAFIEHVGDEGDAHPILSTPFTIGRQSGNDLVLKDPSISRYHAVIDRKSAGQFVISDLGALNGVIVNGARQKETKLKDGDMVELGDLGIKFGLEVDADATSNDETVVLSKNELTLPGLGALADRPVLDFALDDDDPPSRN